MAITSQERRAPRALSEVTGERLAVSNAQNTSSAADSSLPQPSVHYRREACALTDDVVRDQDGFEYVSDLFDWCHPSGCACELCMAHPPEKFSVKYYAELTEAYEMGKDYARLAVLGLLCGLILGHAVCIVTLSLVGIR